MVLGDLTVQIGGFHDHWLRNGTDNPTLLMAAMQYYGYDFICLMDSAIEGADTVKKQVEEWLDGVAVYIGHEDMYGFGHMLNINNDYERDFNSLDYINEFKKAKSEKGFTALAHICYPKSFEHIVKKEGAIDYLIDNNLVDAIQLERPGDWKYVEHRAREGKKLPLVGGWDSHRIKDKKGLTNALYFKNANPDGHLDSAPKMRTIVFCEDNSFESILSAVRAGKTVLEYVETKELFGSPEYVEALKSRGYIEKMEERVEKYSQYSFAPPVLTSGDTATLKFSISGKVYYPDAKLNKLVGKTDENGNFVLDSVPMPVNQDMSYIPIAIEGENGGRLYAVKVKNKINVSVYPVYRDGKRYILLKSEEAPINAEIKVKLPVPVNIVADINKDGVLIPLPDDVPTIFDYDLIVRSGNCERRYAERTCAISVGRFSGDWENVRSYKMNSPEFCGGYGNNRKYPGEDEFSMTFGFAYDEDNFYCRMNVTDAVHVPPPYGEQMYNGDCVYFALEPKVSHGHPAQSTGSLSLSIGAPVEAGPVAQSDLSLSGTDYLKKFEQYEGGRIIEIAIPWSDISKIYPITAEKNTDMAIGVGATNDNGAGVVDGMMWPRSTGEKMRTTDDFAILTLE